MGHLHLDHAGGLENFRGTNIPVYTHEIELRHAFYSVATKSDLGVYLLHYLQFNMNWQTWTGDSLELCQGVTLRHAPGHTPGLSIIVVNIKDSGTWIFTTDQYHIKENEEDSHSQGVCIFSEHKFPFIGCLASCEALLPRQYSGFATHNTGFATPVPSKRSNADSEISQWLARDHDDWVRSHQMIKMLQRRTNAKTILRQIRR
jgi:hypothetical protein